MGDFEKGEPGVKTKKIWDIWPGIKLHLLGTNLNLIRPKPIPHALTLIIPRPGCYSGHDTDFSLEITSPNKRFQQEYSHLGPDILSFSDRRIG